jgi:hypothetical protein
MAGNDQQPGHAIGQGLLDVLARGALTEDAAPTRGGLPPPRTVDTW